MTPDARASRSAGSEVLIRNAHHVATLSDSGERWSGVDIWVRDGKIAAIGPDLEKRRAPGTETGSTPAASPEGSRRSGHDFERIPADTCLVLPGLVNTHHHLFQTLTRNVPAAQNAGLFDWLVRLYEVWKFLDAETVYWSTLLGGAELLLTGCTTTSDHLYLFPRAAPAELLDAQIDAAERIGMRFHAGRGSMSRGRSNGGLPPDEVVQDEETILRDCERVIARYHDGTPFALRRVVLAPCSPFSVTDGLMRETVQLARRHGVHCHTHLAETEDENTWCLEHHGRRPLRLMEELGWLGPDIWFAHGVHFDASEIELLARTRTGVAHCPTSNMRLGSGIAPLGVMRARGVAVGLGVDGSASNDASDMLAEVRQAMLLARVRGGASALDADTALRLATRGSAQLLGRGEEIGSIEVGKAADLVLVELDRLDLAGALSDPLAAVVFAGMTHQVRHVLVGGKVVVRDGRLITADPDEIARRGRELSLRMLRQAGCELPFGAPGW
jgi:cytosine/adenosine deaminase-related metal-dependent hydrolase